MRRERWHAIYVQVANGGTSNLTEPESARAVVASQGCNLCPQTATVGMLQATFTLGLLQSRCYHGNATMELLQRNCYNGDATMGMLQWKCYNGATTMELLQNSLP